MNNIGSVIESVWEVSVGQLVGRWLVGQIFIISLKGGKLHFHAPIGALFNTSMYVLIHASN